MKKDYSDNFVLLQSLNAEELEAFNFLYTSLRERLYILAFSILRNQEAARDLVQHVFMEFWEGKIYRNITVSVKMYLLQTVRYKALTILEKEKTASRLKQAMPASPDWVMNYSIENRELKHEIETAIESLPPMASRVFRLHYIEKMSHKDIAQMLNISTSTVSSHIARALKGLRQQLSNIKKQGVN
jgi:RNA polymerase sigma factor, sigma-70 family